MHELKLVAGVVGQEKLPASLSLDRLVSKACFLMLPMRCRIWECRFSCLKGFQLSEDL